MPTHPRWRPISIFAIAIFLITLISTTQAATWQGRNGTRDGLPTVINPPVPMEGAEIVTPAELWRIGGEDGSDDELFAIIEDLLLDEEGNTYLLDVQLNEIRVFSPEGRFLRVFGRVGEGPGEFNNPSTFCLLPDDLLGVVQLIPSRIARMDREGNGRDDLSVPTTGSGEMVLITGASSVGDRLYLVQTTLSFADARQISDTRLITLDAQGELITTLMEQRRERTMGSGGERREGAEESFEDHWVADPRGRVYTAPWWSEYRILVIEPDGESRSYIELEYEHLKRTRGEIAKLEERNDTSGHRVQRPPFKANPIHRDIASLLVRDSGELWVISSRGEQEQAAGTIGPFDVFDRQGRYLKRQSIQADFDPKWDSYHILGDRLYVVKEALNVPDFISESDGITLARTNEDRPEDDEDHEPAPLEIICYRLK